LAELGKKENYKRYKSNVFVKAVRAKLTRTWEGGGIEGGKNQINNFLLRGHISTPTPMGNRVNF